MSFSSGKTSQVRRKRLLPAQSLRRWYAVQPHSRQPAASSGRLPLSAARRVAQAARMRMAASRARWRWMRGRFIGGQCGSVRRKMPR